MKPVSACADLAHLDLAGLKGGSARIDASDEVAAANGKAGYCKVTGYIASNVRFEVRPPLEGWTQRFLMVGCGGYCGFVAIDDDSVGAQSRSLKPCNSPFSP